MSTADLPRRSVLAATGAIGAAALIPGAAAALSSSSIDVHGTVASGWEPVADAFRANFANGQELGASCCVYVDGRPVVDLWGGIADRETNRPWERNTVALVASTTKGATALCAHLLVERGRLDLDAPVARYWPEFAQSGKANMPVRYLLSHQAGLPLIDPPVTFAEACRWYPVIRALEVQKPLWVPGTEHLYHAQTYGFLVGEVVRRITGKSLGTFFHEEIAAPLKLSTWIGLPADMEPRLARPAQAPPPNKSAEEMTADFGAALGWSPAETLGLTKILFSPDSTFLKAALVTGGSAEDYSSRAYRAAEFPAANMVTNAHALARMYAASVGEVDGLRLLRPDTVAAMTKVQTDRSRMHGVPQELQPAANKMFKMSLGFWRPIDPGLKLLGPASFGHPGSGGSLGAGDPEAKVGFGYVPNLRPGSRVDPRAKDLTDAVRKCLGRA